MKHPALLLGALLLTQAAIVSAQAPSTTTLIAGAVLAAPDSLRDGAAVITASGEVLRKGSNSLVCLADDPAREGFQVACYHRDLDPFMARGRSLKGMKREQVDSVRRAEIKAGKLKMAAGPAALYNLMAPKDSLDATTGLPRGGVGQRWYVVYLPGATEASTGFSVQPDGTGRPWLMYAGEPWAHVMVTPK